MAMTIPLIRTFSCAFLAAIPFSCSTDAAEENLPSADPIQIAQYPSAPFEDQNGNLWIRTVLDGLVRYDGKEFVTFTVEDGLGSNMIRDMLETKDGVLWIATSGGLTKYDGKNFTTLIKYAADSNVNDEVVLGPHGNHRDLWELWLDQGERLWIASMDGVFRLDGDTLTRHPMPGMSAEHDFEFTANMVYDIFQDRSGAMWFCTDGAGVIRDDGKTQISYTVEDGLASNFVCNMVQDQRGDFWFGTSNGGVSHFDGKTFTTHLRNKEYSESMGWGRFMGLHIDRQGSIWFAAAGPVPGAYRFDGQEFHYYSNKDGLGPGHVASISEDRAGNLWFGTTAGVYRFDGKQFVNLPRNP
jgi:ligand-binding sensor domain-containing protein